MRNNGIIFILILIFMLSSCQKEVKVLTEGYSDNSILISKTGEGSNLIEYDIEKSVIINEDFLDNSDVKELESIDMVYLNADNISDDNYYILSKKSLKIICVNRFNDSTVAVYDFNEKGLIPTEIGFPNSSNIYVVHENSNVMTVVDVINHEFGREIKIGQGGVSIVTFQNELYIANKVDRTISRVKTNLKEEVDIFKIKHKEEGTSELYAFMPVDLIKSKERDEDELIILTSGNTEEEESKARVIFMNRYTGQILRIIKIEDDGISSSDITANQVLLTESDWLFVATDYKFFRLNMESFGVLNVLSKIKVSSMFYVKEENRLVVLEEKDTYQNIRKISIGGSSFLSGRLNFEANKIFPL